MTAGLSFPFCRNLYTCLKQFIAGHIAHMDKCWTADLSDQKLKLDNSVLMLASCFGKKKFLVVEFGGRCREKQETVVRNPCVGWSEEGEPWVALLIFFLTCINWW